MQKPELSATIIDDEQDARNILSLLLRDLFPFIRVEHEANGVRTGVQTLSQHTTDLVFLDVEMGDGSGFDLLDRLPTSPGMVVFVTAYDKYAIQALRAAAFDYILKPLNREDLQRVVNRALCAMLQRPDSAHNTPQDQPNMLPSGFKKVALPNLSGVEFVDADSISRCQADGNYTVVHFTNGNKEVISRSLGQLEQDLAAHGFFRIHHKHLINLRYVSAYQKGKAGGSVRMQDSSQVEVSTRRKAELMRLFS